MHEVYAIVLAYIVSPQQLTICGKIDRFLSFVVFAAVYFAERGLSAPHSPIPSKR